MFEAWQKTVAVVEEAEHFHEEEAVLGALPMTGWLVADLEQVAVQVHHELGVAVVRGL